jgi:hypothetical protein
MRVPQIARSSGSYLLPAGSRAQRLEVPENWPDPVDWLVLASCDYATDLGRGPASGGSDWEAVVPGPPIRYLRRLPLSATWPREAVTPLVSPKRRSSGWPRIRSGPWRWPAKSSSRPNRLRPRRSSTFHPARQRLVRRVARGVRRSRVLRRGHRRAPPPGSREAPLGRGPTALRRARKAAESPLSPARIHARRFARRAAS